MVYDLGIYQSLNLVFEDLTSLRRMTDELVVCAVFRSISLFKFFWSSGF